MPSSYSPTQWVIEQYLLPISVPTISLWHTQSQSCRIPDVVWILFITPENTRKTRIVMGKDRSWMYT